MRRKIHDEGMFTLEIDDNNLLIWTTRYYEKDEKKGLKDLHSFTNTLQGIFNQHPKKQYSILVDVTPVQEKTYNVPVSAKQAFRKMYQNPQIYKVAMIGANNFFNKLGEMLSRFTGKWKKLRIFEDEEEAIRWALKKK